MLIGTVQCTCVRIRHIWDGKQAVGLHKMRSGLGSFEPTMGFFMQWGAMECSRNLQARDSKFEVTSVATG